MCGIAGFVDFKFKSDELVLNQMVDVLKHRGPDDKGVETYKESLATVGLGQSRLSIIDLSDAGHQPMHYKDLSIVFNGEIYNYKELKTELVKLGHKFDSNSDTEVILKAMDEWGDEAVHRLIGMFSFVLYNRKKQQINAFVDRAGVKPFYYYWKDGLFLFASELKSMHEHPAFVKEINVKAVQMYFEHVHHGYIAAPYTIFENTFKLEQGTFITFDLTHRKFEIEKYWDISTYYRLPKLSMDYNDAKNQLHDILVSACNYRMVSDVPVGVFLSGGYDSTLVTSILQKENTHRIKTFTIGFEEGNNEAPEAKIIAEYLDLDHTEYICTSKEAQEIIPDLPYYYDEPYADSSSIPTILVSRIAKNQVKVALSADGGDEIFAGYTTYQSLLSKSRLLNKIPNTLKGISSSLLNLNNGLLPQSSLVLKHKIQIISNALNVDSFKQSRALHYGMNSMPNYFNSQLFAKKATLTQSLYKVGVAGFQNELEVAMAVDYKVYLQNDILTKVDRATMSNSLEGREPLLDHRIIEFAAQLPTEYKYDGVTTKRILKDIVHKYVPQLIMDRPKSGFSLPIYSWLRGDLAYLIDEYLNEKALKSSGLFNVPFVTEQVGLFNKKQFHYEPFIWKILMFQMWWERWMT